MSEDSSNQAELEIDSSLRLTKFCMRRIGLSFEPPITAMGLIKQRVIMTISVLAICYHVFSEIAYIGLTLSNSPRVEDVVPLFHTFGYGLLSIAKVSVLWYKKEVFGELIKELSGIWPTSPLDEEAQTIKDKSLAALNLAHLWYFNINTMGVWFYNLTPIAIYFYEVWQGVEDAKIGFVWVSWYPFDKHQPIAHVAVYIFEIFAATLPKCMRQPFIQVTQVASSPLVHSPPWWTYGFTGSYIVGVTCVWIMIGTDLLFSAMASHIALLLRLLRRKLESVAESSQSDGEYYVDIVDNIKLHQRLIKYCNDLEEAFVVSNFVNYILSSINICCVVFVIVLLEPFVAVSNKLFLCSALIQIGMICWYGDDILQANGDIAMAAYNSGWYRTNPKCRKALQFLMRRAQKPIAFTAMKFTNISLVTYSSILTRSYSYFALLYTMYSEK